MALDQALLEHCEATGQATLRLYQWSPATLSLGYFQRISERESHRPSAGLELVRRATGGGAIVHDQELTYSLCLPSEQRWSRANRELYDAVHRAILASLAEFGIEASLYPSNPGEVVTVAEPAVTSQLGCSEAVGSGCGAGVVGAAGRFLCFERRSPGDVVLAGFKVGGSAQRRGKQALLQHGSILLRKSNFAPELPGIEELTAKTLETQLFAEKLLAHLSLELHLRWEPCRPTDSLEQRAREIEQAVFGNPSWSQNR